MPRHRCSIDLLAWILCAALPASISPLVLCLAGCWAACSSHAYPVTVMEMHSGLTASYDLLLLHAEVIMLAAAHNPGKVNTAAVYL